MKQWYLYISPLPTENYYNFHFIEMNGCLSVCACVFSFFVPTKMQTDLFALILPISLSTATRCTASTWKAMCNSTLSTPSALKLNKTQRDNKKTKSITIAIEIHVHFAKINKLLIYSWGIGIAFNPLNKTKNWMQHIIICYWSQTSQKWTQKL